VLAALCHLGVGLQRITALVHSRSTVRADTLKPWRTSSSASLAALLDVQRNSDMGSPGWRGAPGCPKPLITRAAFRSVACRPARGTEPFGRLQASITSRSALITVLRLIPDASATAVFAAPSQHFRRRTCHYPTLHLVHMREHNSEEAREPFGRDLHTVILSRAYYVAGTLS